MVTFLLNLMSKFDLVSKKSLDIWPKFLEL